MGKLEFLFSGCASARGFELRGPVHGAPEADDIIPRQEIVDLIPR